jgi:uncharacterized membrane protein
VTSAETAKFCAFSALHSYHQSGHWPFSSNFMCVIYIYIYIYTVIFMYIYIFINIIYIFINLAPRAANRRLDSGATARGVEIAASRALEGRRRQESNSAGSAPPFGHGRPHPAASAGPGAPLSMLHTQGGGALAAIARLLLRRAAECGLPRPGRVPGRVTPRPRRHA